MLKEAMMSSYMDMTFCLYYPDCASGKSCPRALTDEIQQDAIMWYGNDNAPISIFAGEPHCFVETEEKLEEMHRQAEAYAIGGGDDE